MTPEQFHTLFHRVRDELAKVVVGQHTAVEHLLVAIYAGGHVLLRGMPSLGRTLLVNTLAQVMGLDYRRIQFTPDLLPTDIIGTEMLENHVATGSRLFRFFKGPVFANLVLVDEINRSPTRTQSALLETMQERQVTAGGRTHFLPKPFILVATENSLDTEGIWRLGEAQLDRFMLSIEQHYPDADDERRILRTTTGSDQPHVNQVTDPATILAMQSLARDVPVVPSVRDFALAIVRGSRPGEGTSDRSLGGCEDLSRDREGAVVSSGKPPLPHGRGSKTSKSLGASVRLGASPRAAQALLLGAKVTALARGRTHVVPQDVVDVAAPVMRHRVLLDVQAQAEGFTVDQLLGTLLDDARKRYVASRDDDRHGVMRILEAPRI